MSNLDIITSSNTPTMSTREIAKILGKQHVNIKVSAERLAASGTIALQDTQYTNPQNSQSYREYNLNKRDSIILVAQNCPEFTAAIVDRWQALEALNLSAPANQVSIDGMMIDAVDTFRANLIKSVQAAISSALMPTMPEEDRLIKQGEDLKSLAHALYFDGHQPYNVQPVNSESGIPTVTPRSNKIWRLRNYKMIGRIKDWSCIDAQKKGDLLAATKRLIELEIKHGLRPQ